MAPGRKERAMTRPPPEAPLTEYEHARAQEIMRNNQVLASLGIGRLKAILSNTSARVKDNGPQHSGSLFDQDSVNLSAGGLRTSKRVVAPQQQEETTRVTRQKTTATLSLIAATHDELVSTTTTSQNEEHIHSSDQGAVTPRTQEVQRGVTRGKELDCLSRGLGTKVAIHITEGKRRPEAPMQAAKLASEGGITLRQHIPIFPHWKEYRKKNEDQIDNYIGKLAAQFTMDIDSKPVKDACVDMLKRGQRQRRYTLKKKYFDRVPANQVRTTSPVNCMDDDQWRALVEMWSSPKHKDKCLKNQVNREKVVFQQRTGSRCYIACAYVAKQEKYKDTEPTAIDLFKDTHCSKKSGFSESVKNAIASMDTIRAEPVQEGQQPKSDIQVVAQVLPQSSTFLQNIGLKYSSGTSSRGVVASQVQELQAQLESEKQEKSGLQLQVDTLRMHAEESEATMAKQSEEIQNLKKAQEENNNILRQLINFKQVQLTPP